MPKKVSEIAPGWEPTDLVPGDLMVLEDGCLFFERGGERLFLGDEHTDVLSVHMLYSNEQREALLTCGRLLALLYGLQCIKRTVPETTGIPKRHVVEFYR
jgi:hypothetical protein